MPAGRPTDYTEELAALFCSELALGNSLRSVCAREDMPSHQTIYNWFTQHPEFLEQYARAKKESADSDADKIEHIAEMVLAGEVEPNAGRVAIDAYKWTSSRKEPKKYGDRITQDVNVNDYRNLSEEELRRAIRERQQQFQESHTLQ